MKKKFDLGEEVKCKITWYQGVVVARTDYIYGCVRYGVQNTELDENGEIKDWVWFDEEQLKSVSNSVKITMLEDQVGTDGVKASQSGGPREDAPNR